MDSSAIGEIATDADTVTPAPDAKTVAEVEVVVPAVATEKVAVVCPAATVTVVGTVADSPLVDKLSMVPPVGAGELSVTVPVAGVPPTTDVGEMVNPIGTGIERNLSTKPVKFGAPHPEAVSHPGPALELLPSGSVPLFPVTTSKKIVGSPLYE